MPLTSKNLELQVLCKRERRNFARKLGGKVKVNRKEKESVDALDEREKKSFFYNCVTNKLLWLPEMQL